MSGRGDGEPEETPVPAAPAARPGGIVRRTLGGLLPRRRDLRGTVYLVLDRSTSMGDPGKMAQLRTGAFRFFLEAVRRGYAVGAVGFAGDARLVCGAGLNAHRFWRRLHELRAYGRTAMDAGLRLATGRLSGRRGHRVMILITDGVADDREGALEAARAARARGIAIVPIGIGDADHAFLASLAGRPELARHVPRERLAGAIEAAAHDLADGG